VKNRQIKIMNPAMYLVLGIRDFEITELI